MSRYQQQSSGTTAHSKAVQALTDARQNTRKWRYHMEQSEDVVEDAIFIDPNDARHPQKMAHAALIDYHEEVNQPEYTIKAEDLWQENLTSEGGHEIEIRVPKHDLITKTVSEVDIDDPLPSREDIETKTESISLEILSHRWSGRSVTVEITVDSPYRTADVMTRNVRLWLPPVAIKAAYSQLNGVLSKIGLLAQTTAPIEHDPEPI